MNHWEKLYYENRLERMKVPGGWLVRTHGIGLECIAICFYPDPEHKWEVKTTVE